MSSFDFDKRLSKARHLMELRNHAEALKLYAKLAKQVQDGILLVEYGHAALISGDIDLAERIWEKARGLEPGNIELLARLAAEHQKIGLYRKTRELYAEAAKVDPKSAGVQLSLALLEAEIGGVDEARGPINKSLELEPRNETARYLSAQLNRRENKHAEAERELRDMLAGGLRDAHVRYSCYFELAQVLDRTGRYDEAMAALAEGKELARQTVNYPAELKSFDGWHEMISRATKTLPKNVLEIWGKQYPEQARAASVPLVFLGGPARSGATLLEKVLDAHPSVAACDESRAFPDTLALIDIGTQPIPAQRLNILRERYLKMFAKALGSASEGKTLLDKNPQPTIFLPAFLRVFPELRVIIAVRDPRDAVLSLYFHNQRGSNFFPLDRLAAHYSSLMNIWLTIREWDGLGYMETRYEDLVADLRKEGGRVTEFIGLKWDEGQARYYEKNREKAVMSGNYNDVSKPVHAKAVGRWRAYEKHLAPILPVLEPYCKKFGYV